jgi:hypothetical protein
MLGVASIEWSAGISAAMAPEMAPSKNPTPANVLKKIIFFRLILIMVFPPQQGLVQRFRLEIT